MSPRHRKGLGIAHAMRVPLSMITGRRWVLGTEQEVLAAIRPLRHRLPHVTGVLVASTDGLLIAHDTENVEPETMAAMSAAHLGLGQRMTMGGAYGEFQETVTRAANGYVATFAAGSQALLTVLAEAELNVGRLHHEARPVAAQVGALVSQAEQRSTREKRR